MITIRWYSPRQLGSTQEGASFLLEVARCAGSVLLEEMMSSIMMMALNQKWWWCWRRWTNREIFEEQIAPIILDIEQQPKDQDKKHSTDEIRYFIWNMKVRRKTMPQISSLSNTSYFFILSIFPVGHPTWWGWRKTSCCWEIITITTITTTMITIWIKSLSPDEDDNNHPTIKR